MLPPFDPGAAAEASAQVGFATFTLDRHSERREEPGFVEAHRADPRARFFIVLGETPLLGLDGTALFDAETIGGLDHREETVFLGTGPDGPLFGIGLGKDVTAAIEAWPDLAQANLRSLAIDGSLPPALLGPLGAAKAVLGWHARHRFCSVCGQPSVPAASGWRRDCPACGAQHFPRVDPVVIMLAISGDKCLLGRQGRFATGQYSCLAGFLEPGETAEDCVRRETLEEAGIRVGQVRYFATQPWPFPSSLMMGFHAEALGDEIKIDEKELEHARWFSREETLLMLDRKHPEGLITPPPFAIAHHIIRAFAEG
jgi:NAD+ diphosphatase